MSEPIAVHLVTTEKKNGKVTEQPSVEKFESVTAARTEMREYIRLFLDEGWERVPNPKPLRKKPVTITVTDGDGRTVTCTVVRTNNPPRKLRPELNLSE